MRPNYTFRGRNAKNPRTESLQTQADDITGAQAEASEGSMWRPHVQFDGDQVEGVVPVVPPDRVAEQERLQPELTELCVPLDFRPERRDVLDPEFTCDSLEAKILGVPPRQGADWFRDVADV